MSPIDQEEESTLNLSLEEERAIANQMHAPLQELPPIISLEESFPFESKSVQIDEIPQQTTPGGILPHYLTIDFQGCQLNVNFYDAPQNEGVQKTEGQKPIAQHDVIQHEENLILPEKHPEAGMSASTTTICDQPSGCLEAHDVLVPPSKPPVEPDLPTPDPIWFA